MDRGAWWATVLGVTKSQTCLKQLSMHACTSITHAQIYMWSCVGVSVCVDLCVVLCGCVSVCVDLCVVLCVCVCVCKSMCGFLCVSMYTCLCACIVSSCISMHECASVCEYRCDLDPHSMFPCLWRGAGAGCGPLRRPHNIPSFPLGSSGPTGSRLTPMVSLHPQDTLA